MDNNIGKKLDGRYELVELIGVGGMADIYKANDIVEDRTVAVKILKTEFAGSDEFLRRFRNESKAIALLSHPNIVKIYDVGFSDSMQFIVMEYIDGITLTEYIEQQGVLKWRDAVHFTIQILRALQHAHDRGIVHRDIKSQNVMLLQDGTIKVMDFGIARFNRETDKTISEKAIGSVHYISPEQARGDITDERSDIYSVGIMLYEMLTGKKPFDGDNPVSIALMHMQTTAKKPTEINGTIPEGLEEITLKAMQKEPSKRYQTAGEMIKDIEEFKKNPSIVFEYKYFSTDGTTKYFDKPEAAVKEPVRRAKKVVEPEYEEDDEEEDDEDEEVEERRSPLLPILFAVGSAFVIATAFLLLYLFSDLVGDKTSNTSDTSVSVSDEFSMPNLVGMSWKEAVEQYSDYITLVAEQEYSTYDKNVIFEQEYIEGRKVKVGTEITVKVSKGIKEVEIQDFTGRAKDEVVAQLKKDGLKPKLNYTEDEEVTKDFVIRTEPGAHEMVPVGSEVVVLISLGPAATLKCVPDMINMKKAIAEQRCEEYNLVPVFIEEANEAEAGTVINQSIEPGEFVERNTTIELTISTGEIPVLEKELPITLPTSASGEFIFKYYVDGIKVLEETRDVGLSANKSLSYTVEGTKEEVKSFVIKVTSTDTNESGTYIEIEVDFTGEKPKASTIAKDSKIFKNLQKATTTADEEVTTPPEEIGTGEADTTPEPEETTAPEETTEPEPSESTDMPIEIPVE